MVSSPNTFVLCSVLFATACCAASEPTLPTADEIREKRAAIYGELDENVEAVKQCFELLDSTDQEDKELREYLDLQIQQFDDRSSVLHNQLAEIDRFEFLSKRKVELAEQAKRLKAEAAQLRAAGHNLPAQLRAAKAKSIEKSLADGTWKILVDDFQPAESSSVEMVTVLQVKIEVENLKEEVTTLRAEVESLRKLVKMLEKRNRK